MSYVLRELSFYAHKRANDNTIPAEKRVVFECQGDYLCYQIL